MTEVDSASPLLAKDTQEHPDELVSKKENAAHVTYWTILKRDPAFEEVSTIVYWRDPIKSGLIFGIISLSYFLLTWGEYTLVSLVSYLLLSLLAVSFIYVKFNQFKAQTHNTPPTDPLIAIFGNQTYHIPKDRAEKHLATFIAIFNHTADGAREVFLCNNTILTLKFIALFYLLGRIGDWFSGPTYLYLVTLGLFAWPRFYEEKHSDIDRVHAMAHSEGRKYFKIAVDTIEKKAPPAVAPYVRIVTDKLKTQ